MKTLKKKIWPKTNFSPNSDSKKRRTSRQVRLGFIEPTGERSLFYYEDKEVKPGLPLIPDVFKNKQINISKKAIYACIFCGQTQEITKGTAQCPACKRNEWVESLSNRRIS